MPQVKVIHMHIAPLLRDLAIILAVAAFVTLLFKKIRQPVVLGYLVAGMIVGPSTLPFPLVSDLPNIQTWAQLGVIFLMFSIGLEFTFKRLARVGRAASITALIEVAGMFSLGLFAGRLLGWNSFDSLFLGGLCAISSTTIILKAFEARGLKNRGFAQLVFGVLIVEDLIAILMLVGFTLLFKNQGALVGREMFQALLQLVLIVGSWFIAGYFFIPTVLKLAASLLDDETLTITAVGLCLILVYGSTRFGYSPALGAFIMGSILAETRASHRIEQLIRPLRDLFAAVFFVSVGMLMDPGSVRGSLGTIFLISGLVIVGKISSATVGAALSGKSIKRSIQVGFSLGQIGEFSFILAALGVTLKVTSSFVYPMAVAVSVITTFATPYLIGLAEPCASLVEKYLPIRLLDFQQRYATWLNQPREFDATSHDLRRAAVRFFLNAILVSTLFLSVASYGRPLLAHYFESRRPLDILSWISAVLLSAPFLWGMLAAFRPKRRNQKRNAANASQMAFFASHLVTVILIGALSDRFVSTSTSFLVTLIGSGVVFFIFFRRLESSYHWFEKRFLSNLGGNPEETEAAWQSLAPWDLQLTRLAIPTNSAIAGKTLQEAEVRKLFGLNIVILSRGNHTIALPTADMRLLPGDELLVLATEAQIAAFQKMLDVERASFDTDPKLSDYALRRFIINAASPFLGKTIQGADLRRKLKGLVVGLERGARRTTNPVPDTVLENGDCLWIVGEPV